jgi:hypothetical protein
LRDQLRTRHKVAKRDRPRRRQLEQVHRRAPVPLSEAVRVLVEAIGRDGAGWKLAARPAALLGEPRGCTARVAVRRVTPAGRLQRRGARICWGVL